MRMSMLFCSLVLVCSTHLTDQKKIVVKSSCTENTKWNNRNIRDSLLLWWNSITSGYGEGEEGGPTLLKYRRSRESYSDFYTGSLDLTSSLPTLTSQVSDGIPDGLTWQAFDADHNSGFLYGLPDTQGAFTGDNLLYIYPDFLTGIYGSFVDGQLEEGVEAKITAERCFGRIKELRFKLKNVDKILYWDADSNATFLGRFPTRMDPHERKSVYIGNSNIPGSGEGIFVKRNFLPGDIVSYFHGVKTYVKEYVFDNMTTEETYIANSYAISLSSMPEHWDIDPDMVIDMPVGFRRVSEFCTTLCHKVNHKFGGTNVDFSVTAHPIFGYISCARASKPILRGEEIFVHYGYSIQDGPPWYKEAYRQYIINRNREYILKKAEEEGGKP